MTVRLLTLIALCGLLIGSPALAQDCGSGSSCEKSCSDKNGCTDKKDCSDCSDCTDCGDCKKCDQKSTNLVAAVAKLEASAAKGCETSTEKLAALRTAIGASEDAKLSELVATYVEYAEKGCGSSCATVEKMQSILATEPASKDPLSLRVAMLVKAADGGCEKSAAKLEAFGKACGAGCAKSMVDAIDGIEADAADGSKTAAFKLVVLEARFEGKAEPKAPLSIKVAMMEERCGKGCEKSGKKLVAVREAAGIGADADLVAYIETLESKAAKGDKDCVAKLATIEAKMPAAKSAKKKASCGSGEGCAEKSGKCGGDCSGGDCKPEGCDKPDCCKKQKKAQTQ